jgi:hypothetical protein
MRKISLFLTLSALLTISLLSAQEEQKSYLPIFGADTTRYYVIAGRIDDCPFTGHIDIVKDKNEDNVYNVVTFGIPYRVIETDERNSKIWGHYWTIDGYTKHLLMDLDLEVGDQFIDPKTQGYPWERSYPVSKVYIKDNRKHIEFEGLYNVERLYIDDNVYVDKMPYLFIEGVGPNIVLGSPANSMYGDWLRSQYKDRVFAYGVPEFYPYWGYFCHRDYSPDCGWCDLDDWTANTSIMADKSRITYEVENNLIRISIPNDLPIKQELSINVLDAGGKMIQSEKIKEPIFSLDMNKYPTGVYFIQTVSTEIYDVFKFLKR